VVHAMALPLLYGGSFDEGCLSLRSESADLRGSAEGIEDAPAGKALAERGAAWAQRLPEAAAGLWDWLLAQDAATRLDLLAHCAGCTVNAVRKPHEREDAERFSHADRLAKALGLDMGQWWQPTAASYLGRVSKARILEAVQEAVSPEAAENLGTMKKDALVAEAEQRLSGTGWLPLLLRSPVVSASCETRERETAE